jgi:hypothetical protein
MVEKHLSEKYLSKREVLHLGEDRLFKLKQNPEKAYGTTLNAAMIFGNKLICVSIGDGGVILVRKGEIALALPEDDETVANITYSMCQEDAYEHLKVEIFDFSDLDGVIVCTDGLINPYQSLANFRDRFVKPVCLKIEAPLSFMENFITSPVFPDILVLNSNCFDFVTEADTDFSETKFLLSFSEESSISGFLFLSSESSTEGVSESSISGFLFLSSESSTEGASEEPLLKPTPESQAEKTKKKLIGNNHKNLFIPFILFLRKKIIKKAQS